MGRKKKPFINKKQAQSFRLVHRSQRDPLQADEGSSQYILHPVKVSSSLCCIDIIIIAIDAQH